MIKSKYILSVMRLLIDGVQEEDLAFKQLEYINDSEYDYTTGGGLFVNFSHDEKVLNFVLKEKETVLDGVEIKSIKHALEARAILYFKNGLIDYLEIWCVTNNYPINELESYSIKQIWNGSKCKIISTENE